jgi:hypothetical protein
MVYFGVCLIASLIAPSEKALDNLKEDRALLAVAIK